MLFEKPTKCCLSDYGTILLYIMLCTPCAWKTGEDFLPISSGSFFFFT